MEFLPARSKSDPRPFAPPATDFRRVRSDWDRRRQRALLMIPSVGVLLYSVLVLLLVAWMGDIGVRCVFGTDLKEPIPPDYTWTPERPKMGDRLLTVGGTPLENYTDYIKVLRNLSREVNRTVEVRWEDHQTKEIKTAKALVSRRPPSTYIWSLVWFLQEMVIFAIGARVFWKRPHDGSARLFFWLCIVTVGAYMGGYHWTEIVVEPLLIYPFAAFAVFVPVVSLHFYLVFPRLNPALVNYRRGVLAALYGVPWAYLLGLWASMLRSRWLGNHAGGASAACGTASARPVPAPSGTRSSGSCSPR